MSEIKVNSIKGVGASTAAITVNNSDGTATANLTNRQGKNLIINGAMNVAMRATTSTTSGYGSVDRFQVLSSGVDEAPTHAQVGVATNVTPYTLGFRNALKVTNGNQTSGAGASAFIKVQQNTEGQDINRSGWNLTDPNSKLTISYWVKSSVAQTFYGRFRAFASSEYEYTYSFALSANTWTKVTKTIPGNSNFSSLVDTNASGFFHIWQCFFGTDFTNNKTLDEWAVKDNANKSPDMTSTWYTTDNATFELTGVQLEVSDHATSFEHKSFTDDYLRCARYFQQFGGTRVYFAGRTSNTDGLNVSPACPVPMRATPTCSGGGSYELFSSIGSGSSSVTPTIETYQTRDFTQCFIGNVFFTFASGSYCNDARVGSVRIGDTLNFDAEL